MKRQTAWMALIVSMLAFGTAASAADLAEIKKAGVLRALTTAADPPNSYMGDDGKPTGFEIELCEYVAKKIGVKLEMGVSAWAGILPALSAGRTDIICSAANMTASRAQQYDFSVPYSRTNLIALVPINSTATGPTDTANRVIGATFGADGQDAVRAIGGYKDLRVYNAKQGLFGDLANNRLDMVITGDLQAGAYAKANPTVAKIVGKPYLTNLIGYPMAQGSTALKAAVDSAIKDARTDGTIDALGMKYFGLASFTETLPPIGVMPELK